MEVLKELQLHLKHYSCNHCRLETYNYSNGRLALAVTAKAPEEGFVEQVAIATTNLPDQPCPENEVWVKNYSENEGMVGNLIRWGVIEERPTAWVRQGFVTIERFKLTEGFIKKLT